MTSKNSLMKMDSKSPCIELYLYSMNQEFPVGKEHITVLDRESKNLPNEKGEIANLEKATSKTYIKPSLSDNAPASWNMKVIHEKWVRNWEKFIPNGRVIDGLDHPLRRLILREEDFGGIVLDPDTDRVFRVNMPGLEVLKSLQTELKNQQRIDVSGAMYEKASKVGFFEFLAGAGLWNQ